MNKICGTEIARGAKGKKGPTLRLVILSSLKKEQEAKTLVKRLGRYSIAKTKVLIKERFESENIFSGVYILRRRVAASSRPRPSAGVSPKEHQKQRG